jgi:transcriptional repressor NrdR
MVIKSDGTKVPFEREKLMRSLQIALQKRPIDDDRIEQMASGIVRQLESSGNSEVPSKHIGELVMEGLAELDKIAYVRYASVYRDFRAAEDFGEFIQSEQLTDKD